MTELEIYIKSYFGISKEDLSNVASLFKQTTLQKDDFFIQEGKYGVSLSFIRSGFIRIFNYSNGKEITQWISSPGEFITDLSSLIFDTPARWNIKALTVSELYTLSFENYRRISQIVPQWEKLEKLFIAKCFLNLEDRVYSFLSMTAEERYNQFYEKSKGIFNQIPHLYLASMLGMTPETLSRIRRKEIS